MLPPRQNLQVLKLLQGVEFWRSWGVRLLISFCVQLTCDLSVFMPFFFHPLFLIFSLWESYRVLSKVRLWKLPYQKVQASKEFGPGGNCSKTATSIAKVLRNFFCLKSIVGSCALSICLMIIIESSELLPCSKCASF